MQSLIKDEALDRIVQAGGNIARFVSYGPDGIQRYCRINGCDPSHRFATIEAAADTLMRAGARYVNIRSFTPEKPDGNPFVPGKGRYETPVKLATKARELMAKGYYIILNENIDPSDGGISGVLMRGAAEFSTRDIPRCVEKPGCAALSRPMLEKFVSVVYNHALKIPYGDNYRIEFTVAAGPAGYLRQRQIIWQVDPADGAAFALRPPNGRNRVSMDMGDKAYGLVLLHIHGFRVPFTRVFGRVIPYFEFGNPTESDAEPWVRTSPRVKQEGRFTTKHGWLDAYDLMRREDPLPEGAGNVPENYQIASILIQDNVHAEYSGAALTDANGRFVVEGKTGEGDTFMLGETGPLVALPDHVQGVFRDLWSKKKSAFGSCGFEWVYDRFNTPWSLQFHLGQSDSVGDIIYPGLADLFVPFPVSRGIEELRSLVARAKKEGFGIVLQGSVGMTSHMPGILRDNKIPSRRQIG